MLSIAILVAVASLWLLASSGTFTNTSHVLPSHDLSQHMSENLITGNLRSEN